MIYVKHVLWELPCFSHIKHSRKNNNLQKGRSWGAGFCTWMCQCIWVVIIISNALLFKFNGSDWFKTFVWPLQRLVSFTLSCASPFHAANNDAYNHTCIRKKQYFETLWGDLSLEPEVRTTWATSRKANKTWKKKSNKTKQKTKNGRMFGFDSFFLVFPRFFVFLGSETKKKCICCFEWLWSIKISKITIEIIKTF
jgi:hypothetical protein